MRLLFACHGTATTGAELSTLALARAALERDDHVVFALPPHDGALHAVLADELPGACVVTVPSTWWIGTKHAGIAGVLRTLKSMTQVLPWVRVLRRARPDAVIVSSTVAPAPLIACWVLRVPVAVRLSESLMGNPTLQAPVPKRWHAWLIKRMATRTVAVSHYIKEQFEGADLVEAPAVASQPVDLPQSAPAREEPLRLVMLGTLSPEKGQLDAVEALSILRGRGVQVRLRLFGEASPADEAALADAIEGRSLDGWVEHLGVIRDVSDELSRAHASLVLSRNEAYGRVTAESIQAGTPVVAYDRGGTSEILAPGGGLLVPDDPCSLAAAIELIACDPEVLTRLREEVRQRQLTPGAFGDASASLSRIVDGLTPRTAQPTAAR